MQLRSTHNGVSDVSQELPHASMPSWFCTVSHKNPALGFVWKIRPLNAKTYANAKHNNKKLTTLLHILKARLGLGSICVLNEVLVELLFPLNQRASVNTSLGRWKALKRHLIRLAVIQIIGGKLLNGQFLPGNMKVIQIRGNAGLKEIGLTQFVKSRRPSSP